MRKELRLEHHLTLNLSEDAVPHGEARPPPSQHAVMSGLCFFLWLHCPARVEPMTGPLLHAGLIASWASRPGHTTDNAGNSLPPEVAAPWAWTAPWSAGWLTTGCVCVAGMGVYQFAEGHAVRGEWEKGHLHGKGVFKHRDGDEYKGDYFGGLPGGQGKYKWVDGTVYEGAFARGMPHGKGTKSWVDGDRYEGEWSRGKPHGKGNYTWASGRRYQGQWKDGRMEGEGSCFFVNGDRYEGGWKADKKCGTGTYTWADGTSHAGEWG